MSYVATTGGVSGDMVRDLMAESIEARFGMVEKLPNRRHQDLKTAQVYLGKITDSETIRWMDILHGK